MTLNYTCGSLRNITFRTSAVMTQVLEITCGSLLRKSAEVCGTTYRNVLKLLAEVCGGLAEVSPPLNPPAGVRVGACARSRSNFRARWSYLWKIDQSPVSLTGSTRFTLRCKPSRQMSNAGRASTRSMSLSGPTSLRHLGSTASSIGAQDWNTLPGASAKRSPRPAADLSWTRSIRLSKNAWDRGLHHGSTIAGAAAEPVGSRRSLPLTDPGPNWNPIALRPGRRAVIHAGAVGAVLPGSVGL